MQITNHRLSNSCSCSTSRKEMSKYCSSFGAMTNAAFLFLCSFCSASMFFFFFKCSLYEYNKKILFPTITIYVPFRMFQILKLGSMTISSDTDNFPILKNTELWPVMLTSFLVLQQISFFFCLYDINLHGSTKHGLINIRKPPAGHTVIHLLLHGRGHCVHYKKRN